MTGSGSRIEAARRRAAGAKRTAVVASAAVFLALALLARESHHGQVSGATSTGGSGSSSTSQSTDDGFGFDSGSVAPSTAAPDVHSTLPEPRSFHAMGVDVLVGGAHDDELNEIARLFEGWDRVFLRFRRESELNRVNADAAPVLVVSKLFASAVRDALGAASATRGLVDPTLGLAIEAAGYDCDFSLLADDEERPPGPTARGRWRALRLSGRLLSRPAGVRLDLNGVAKALAVDASLDLISGAGFVTAGGDVAARGGAVVGLPHGGSLCLLRGGVATSGTTHRHWRRGGAWQHHLLDPRTGRPAESCWDEVTVAAATCLEADVAAKAAFLLSREGPSWLDERGLPGRFVSGEDVLENRAWCEVLDGLEKAAA